MHDHKHDELVQSGQVDSIDDNTLVEMALLQRLLFELPLRLGHHPDCLPVRLDLDDHVDHVLRIDA